MEEKNHTGTSEKLVQSAEKLFAGKGLYGTSIRDVAETLSIAKSSVLHHFASKEKLYAAVLQNIADEMIREIRAIRQGPEDEAGQMRSFVGLLCDNSRDRPDRDLIILRELLDNRARVDTARKWYFSPYLEELAGIVRSGQDKGRFKPIHPGLFILHL
ncbi:MAG: TetR/AcrR family transcriptional regulator, partial [Pseudomonadota bacterium]